MENMLTKSDLAAIKQLASHVIQHELTKQLTPIKRDIRELRKDLHLLMLNIVKPVEVAQYNKKKD